MIKSNTYHIRKNISQHVRIYKKHSCNKFIWIDITNINDEKTYISICYFTPIKNSNLDNKKNPIQIKKFPYNGFEHDIYSLRKEGNIHLIGDFNAQNYRNHAILLRNYSNPNPLWLDKDLELANMYKEVLKIQVKNYSGLSWSNFVVLRILSFATVSQNDQTLVG